MAACFRALYRLGLLLLSVTFRVNPAIDAILLRRPGVLKDAFAGESDLDLTLLVNERIDQPRFLHSLRRRLRWVRRIIPFCGEFWIIRSHRWQEHALFRVTDYAAPLVNCSVFSRIPLHVSDLSISRSEWKKKQRERIFYTIPGIREGIFGKNRIGITVASRRLSKLRWRETWLSRRTHAVIPALEYPHRHQRLPAHGILSETEHILSLPVQFPEIGNERTQLKTVDIKTVGLFEGPRIPIQSALRAALAPLMNLECETPIEIMCFPIRPYKFQNAIVVLYERPLQETALSNLLAASHALSPRLSAIPFGMTPSFPVVLSRDQFEKWLTLDPLAQIFFEAWNWNISTNLIRCSSDQSYQVEQPDLVLEAVECFDMMESCLRGGETNYLIDLFATASALIEMIHCGRVQLRPLSFLDGLSERAREHYVNSSLTELNDIPLTSVWESLQLPTEQLKRHLKELLERRSGS